MIFDNWYQFVLQLLICSRFLQFWINFFIWRIKSSEECRRTWWLQPNEHSVGKSNFAGTEHSSCCFRSAFFIYVAVLQLKKKSGKKWTKPNVKLNYWKFFSTTFVHYKQFCLQIRITKKELSWFQKFIFVLINSSILGI